MPIFNGSWRLQVAVSFAFCRFYRRAGRDSFGFLFAASASREASGPWIPALSLATRALAETQAKMEIQRLVAAMQRPENSDRGAETELGAEKL